MIKIVNLNKSYKDFEVLNGISFEIKRGTIYGLLGPNGAGKTTIMNILAGLIDYNSGEIYIDGSNFRKNKRELLKTVGYLPQAPVFYNYMNAAEYLHFIGEVSGLSKKESKEKTIQLLESVKLSDAASRRIGQYSGGMRQRLGIAVALFNNPKIVILDEPTAALDPEGRAAILELIQDLKSSGRTILFSTHILSDIERVCNEVSIINQGKIVVSDNLENLIQKYVQPIFDIEFEEYFNDIYQKISSIQWVENVVIDGTRASIYVKDVNTAKAELLPILAANRTPILSYSLRKSNLEDIFIRLVNKNGNF